MSGDLDDVERAIENYRRRTTLTPEQQRLRDQIAARRAHAARPLLERAKLRLVGRAPEGWNAPGDGPVCR